MAQTSTLLNFLLRRNTAKLLLLLLFCIVGVAQTHAQTLPYSYDGGWKTPSGGLVISSGLGADNTAELANSPTGTKSANFNAQGGWVQINVPAGLKMISYAVRGAGLADFTGEFVVSASVDGINYNTIRTISASDNIIRTAGKEKVFDNTLSNDVRYVKFTYSVSVVGKNQYILLDAIKVTPPKPEINVKQTSDITLNATYSFGLTNIKTSNTRTFTIENLGIGQLNLTGSPKVVVSGDNASEFIVNEVNTAAIIEDANSGLGNATTFDITFKPESFGQKKATVFISNNDTDENPYIFNITGNGEFFAPVITQMSPTEGPIATKVTMQGSNFTNVKSVTFANGVSATYTILSDSEIEITVPAGATSGPIKLVVEGGKATSSEAFTVIYDSPTITSFSPNQGYAGELITIRGTNFNEIKNVKFNGVVASYTRINSGEIRASVPSGATKGFITVETPAGVATSSEEFTVLYLVPTIISFDPTEGYVGELVTITGANLTEVQGVWFNGVLANFAEVSETELVAEVPEGATTGTVTVETTAGTATSSVEFTVLRREPVITMLDPYQGYIGDVITITGENFKGVSRILFNGVAASFNQDSETQIRPQVPVGATTGYVTIETAEGTATSPEVFIVLQPAPEIITLNPTEGYVGDLVTITGANLTEVQGVWFNGVLANFAEVSETELVAEVPEGATTGTVTVETTAGTATSSVEFTVLQLLPQITAFSPSEGKVGDVITITGENFANIQEVLFNGVTASFVQDTDTQVSARVPMGATTGAITVTTSAGSATSSEVFTVLNSPKIVLSTTEIDFGSLAVGTSDVNMYQVSATDLNDGASVTVDVSGAPGDYTISRSMEGPFVKTLTIEDNIFDNTLAPTDIWVRYAPAAAGTTSVSITHSTEDAKVEVLTVNGTGAAPLPVELISFKAQKQKEAVLLTWATASEKDNSHFDVEMTDDAKGEFKAVGKVNSKATNSSVKTNYQFSHAGGFVGTRYYRLKQVDLDGTSSYSNVVAVEVTAELQTVKVAPNPISPESKLLFPATEAGKLNITIVNMSGSKVAAKSADVEAGTNSIELDLSEKLPAGMYILTTEFNGKTEQVKLIKR
ncbi:IPT/TIG domain-containing protein [Pontibacter ruber]|uniref:IPT/TIG domain-containing protein n=1 Tax=Pontibacter ruber TaxID=1343895 RepID=A0ABW5CXJ0_9BACT|nr:IPT/TIG domain-containing protein [Pontibacter ruber]